MPKKLLFCTAVAAAVALIAGCCGGNTCCNNAAGGSSERSVWLHPVKSLHTGWNGPEDNETVKSYIDFAYLNGIDNILVDGMHLDGPDDSCAVQLNAYARTLGIGLILEYDNYDLWRWGNHCVQAYADSTLEQSRADADSKELILWPCEPGKNYGIAVEGDACKRIGRMVTSPQEINMYEGAIADIAGTPEFDFFREVSTEWENEIPLAVRNRKYAVVARKSALEGKWFIGGINGSEACDLDVDLRFLEKGHEYEVCTYNDENGRCVVSREIVDRDDDIDVEMPPYGGFAASFVDITVRKAPVCIVPQPSKIVFDRHACKGEGRHHEAAPGVIISRDAAVYAANEEFAAALGDWRNFTAADRLPAFADAESADDAVITISKDASLGAEAYRIKVANGRISIKASTGTGVWWALVSLQQILCQSRASSTGGALFVPSMEIEDAPAYGYRGAHLDCSRHFFSVAEVKTYIDMLALHKLNVFHWHLTDDQGWRIEIKQYPNLTRAGAWRRASQIGQDYWQEDGIPYGPFFYTQDQAREIVSYAASRRVTVIPEIEMPGHAQAAISSYPWLGCSGEQLPVRPLWGSTDQGAVCPSKESTYEFYQNVLDEICDIFPSEYIHIGGDEVDFKNWKECPLCQQNMKDHGFEKEVGLHGLLVKRIEDYMLSKGRRVIGWDEILDGGVSRTATIMSWRGVRGALSAAKLGNDAVMCPARWCYFDRPQSPTDPVYQLVPYDYREMLTMRRAYEFNPRAGLTNEEASHIIGLQSNVWTEYINDFSTVQALFIPRISATAEVGWNSSKTEFDWFAERVNRSLVPLYNNRNYNYFGK